MKASCILARFHADGSNAVYVGHGHGLSNYHNVSWPSMQRLATLVQRCNMQVIPRPNGWSAYPVAQQEDVSKEA